MINARSPAHTNKILTMAPTRHNTPSKLAFTCFTDETRVQNMRSPIDGNQNHRFWRARDSEVTTSHILLFLPPKTEKNLLEPPQNKTNTNIAERRLQNGYVACIVGVLRPKFLQDQMCKPTSRKLAPWYSRTLCPR
jgi:hypothetical protein